jgi:hypothetical protein
MDAGVICCFYAAFWHSEAPASGDWFSNVGSGGLTSRGETVNIR